MSNAADLIRLLEGKAIAMRAGSMLATTPAPHGRVNPDRLAGMMLGLAIGDALGNTTEGMTPATRRTSHGEIRDFLPNTYADGQAVGVPSDDSQLAFWTLERLVEDGGYVPERLAQRFCSEQIFGIGSTLRTFITNMRAGLLWHRAGPKSAGNGALMRVAPMVFPHLRSPSTGLWVDTALSAMTTHNDNAAISSCLAIVSMLWDLLGMDAVPRQDWWVERFCQVLGEFDDGSVYEARGGAYVDRRGSFRAYVEHVIADASEKRLSSLDACESFHSGAYLLETVPCVLYILKEHAGDPEEALVRAVNDSLDNDTIGAIVGAAVGALHGRSALPDRWLDSLTGRTGASDDGRMFELIELAERRFLRG